MLRNKLILISFLLLFLFRLSLVLQNLMWFQDTANDQFFAVKIVNDLKSGKIIIQEGITNSGLDTRYPPFYTYTLGLIRLVNNTYEATLAVHVLLSFLLLIVIYKITSLLSSQNGGLIAILISSISPILIEESAVVYSAYFPLPFAFLSLYLLLKELLNERPSTPKIIFSLFLVAFMTTFSYALNFQLVLSVVLLLFFIKNLIKKLLFSFAGVIFFLLFNLKSVLEFSIYEFFKANFYNLFFPDKEVYRPGLYDNLLQQFYNTPEIFFAGAIVITILFVYFVKSRSNNKRGMVLSLFFYWIMSSAIISRFGQFYKGIFAYPILYIVLGSFLDKWAEGYFPKNISRTALGIVTIVLFTVIPASTFPKFGSLNSSHYYLSKDYIQKLVNEDDSKTLFLILTKRNNNLVYWPSQIIWYFDYLVNNQFYELFPNQFCPALLEGECFRVVPEKIRIICSTEPPEINIFDIVQKSDCVNEARRINSLTGATETYKVNGSYYDISVDQTKYKNLERSFLY